MGNKTKINFSKSCVPQICICLASKQTCMNFINIFFSTMFTLKRNTIKCNELHFILITLFDEFLLYTYVILRRPKKAFEELSFLAELFL